MRKKSKFTPTELTSGKGFDFEDLVGAWLTSYMISYTHFIPHTAMLIKSIHFQVGNNGWIFDDILIEFSDGKKNFKLALSVKSNKQFTSQKAPDDLVVDIWQQFLAENTPFKSECDYLGIVTAPLSGAAKTSLNSLLAKSQHLPNGDLQKQVDQAILAKNVCSLHRSFNCPTTLADTANKLNLNTDEVLKRFKAYQCDFYDQTSTSETQSISNIKSILADPRASKATETFEKICALVKRFRVNGGVLTQKLVTSYIANDIHLKTAPEFARDLEKLNAYSASSMRRIESSIGNQVSLLRAEEKRRVDNSISSEKISVVLGDSGSGKSALVKRLALAHENTIWIEPSLFEYNSWHEAENILFQLKNSWKDLATEITFKYKMLVIDAVDRLWRKSYFYALSEFLEPLISEDSNLKIIITCQSFHWQRVQGELLRIGNVIATANTVFLNGINNSDIAILKDQFPQFTKLLDIESVSGFLLRPKVLDLFSKLAPLNFSNSNHWHSEVELINWYWDTEISNSNNGAMKESFLIKLSRLQADSLTNATQIALFEVSELLVLDELEKSQICYRQKGKIYFSHDIYSDWFKQRTLTDETTRNPSFLDNCIANPQWHRAISLFGAELAQNKHATSEWESIIKASLASKNFLLVDLLLEAIIHASNSYKLLLKHWRFLTENKADLLDRFFTRFLYVATKPNERAITAAKHFNISELDASLLNRTPVWLMWPSVLTLIIEKQDELIELSPKSTADICKLWVANTPESYPYRKDTSKIIIKIGWRALQCNQHYRRHDRWIGHNHNDTSFYYEAVLVCASENTPEVIKFANCASGITEPTAELPLDPPPEPITDPEILKRHAELSTLVYWDDGEEELPPIEDGAKYAKDADFQKLILETNSFISLMIMAPKESANIIMANCIREPGTKYRHSSLDIDKSYGLTARLMGLFPPFYTKTPFLTLLRVSPEHGIRVILRLTEITTSEWLSEERQRRKHEQLNTFDEDYPLSINLLKKDITKKYYGERRWMYACRSTTTPPQLLICALMSLEKWLFDKLDNGEDINQEVEALLTASDSLAIVGVCIQLAKKETALFKGALFDLLKSPWIFIYDLHHCLSDEGHQMIGHGMRETEHQFNQAKKWHLHEYRKTHLDAIIIQLVLSDKEFEKKVSNELIPTIQSWLKNLSKDDGNYALFLRLRHQFDAKNWAPFKNKEGNIQFNFSTPSELLELQKKDEVYFEVKQLLSHLPCKCLTTLNSNGQLDETEFQVIFDKISSISPETLEQEDELLSLARSQCAVAATLILKKDQLPNLYKKNKIICKEVLIYHSLNPPEQEFRIPDSIFEIEWDRFCAKALPELLTENDSENELRAAIAYICLGLHYEALGILMHQFYLLRDVLHEDFYRLLNVVNFWAALRIRVRRATNDNTWGYEPLTAKQLSGKVEKLANNFIDKKLSTTLPTWSNLEVLYKQHKEGKTNKKQLPQTYRKMDCHVIMHGYSWLPALNETTTNKERSEWYNIYHQLSLVLWERLTSESNENGEIDGTPYKIDYWIIEKITSTLLYCSTDAARKLWEPLLSVGPAAEHWIADFMHKWFKLLLKAGTNQKLFLEIWKDMIAFAKDSESWSSESTHWRNYEKVWETVLGLDSFTAKLVWNHDHSEIVKSIKNEYYCYISNKAESCKIDNFSYFLNTASGKVLSLDGITWIYQYISKNQSSRLEKYAQDSVNNLIISILDIHRFDQLSDNHQESIMGLLKVLADRQNTKSMELYKKLTV